MATEEGTASEASRNLSPGWCKVRGPASTVPRNLPGTQFTGAQEMPDPSLVFLYVIYQVLEYGRFSGRSPQVIMSSLRGHHFPSALSQVSPTPENPTVHSSWLTGWPPPINPLLRVSAVSLG